MEDRNLRIGRLLGYIYPFIDISRDDLVSIADKYDFRQLVIPAGREIISPTKPSAAWHIIEKGKVSLTVHHRRRKETTRMLGWAEFFGEEALFYKHQSKITVKAEEETTVFLLYPQQFQALAKDFPEVQKRLAETARSRRIAFLHEFRWLQNDETVYFVSQKHFMYFLKTLIWPGVLFFISAPFLYSGMRNFSAEKPMPLSLWIGLFLLTGSLFWVLWKLIDWRNDFYVVSDRTVAWVEKIVLYYDARTQSSLNKIRGVNRTMSLVGRWLNYGDVIVNAFVGQIPMAYAYKPELLEKSVNEMSKRRLAVLEAEDVEAIHNAVEKAIKNHINQSPDDVIKVITIKKPPPKKKLTYRQQYQEWSNQFRVRYEKDGVITYRKHWPVLLGKLWAPLMLTFLWFVAIILVVAGVIPPNLSNMVLFLLVLMGFGLVLWIWYVYADWRNDIYQLTDRQILDIKKKPLGTEGKRTANLDNILSIEQIRVGFIGNLLNFGDVSINVGELTLVFQGVFYPDQVSIDIQSRKETQEEKKIQEDKKKLREQIINHLIAYYDVTSELGRAQFRKDVYYELRRMKLAGPGAYIQGPGVQEPWQPMVPQAPLSPPGTP